MSASPPPALLRPSTLPELTRDALVDWLIIGALWVLMARAPSLYLLWAVLIAGRLHSLGVLVHDAVHLNLARARRERPLLVRIFELIAAYPIATTLDAMRYHHLRHHRDNALPTDPYFKEGIRAQPLRWWLTCLRGLLMLPFWSTRPYGGAVALLSARARIFYARVYLQDRSGAPEEALAASPEVWACARAELGQLAAQLPLWWGLWVGSEAVTYGVCVPMLFTGVFVVYRLLWEHTYTPAADRRPESVMQTTNDHHLGPLSRVFLAPKHVGHHLAHHLHPTAGWRALPVVRAWYLAREPLRYPRDPR